MFSTDRPFAGFWFVDNFKIMKCNKAVNAGGKSSPGGDQPLASVLHF
jgi:hypothetical protein